MTAGRAVRSGYVTISSSRPVSLRHRHAQEGQQHAKAVVTSAWNSRGCHVQCSNRLRSKLVENGHSRWQPKACLGDSLAASALVAREPNPPVVAQAADDAIPPAEVVIQQSAAVEKDAAGGPCGPPPAQSPGPLPPPVEQPREALKADPQVEPTAAALEDPEQLVRGVTAALASMASLATVPEQMTRFHSKYAPQLSIGDYIGRIRRFFGCEPECFVLCLIYIDRLINRQVKIKFSPLSSHRLIITAITLAAKFHEDIFYSNKYYAKVGGVALQELNMLEQCFLQMIDWKLQVSPKEFQLYTDLARRAATPAVLPKQP